MPGRSVKTERVGPSASASAGSALESAGEGEGAWSGVALYETSIRHSRRGAVSHNVNARSYWWLCDLDSVRVDPDGAAVPAESIAQQLAESQPPPAVAPAASPAHPSMAWR